MSDASAENADRLDLREQLARIDRTLDEGAKLRAEAAKLAREAAKLEREGAKLDRDRMLAPFTLAIASVGAGAALFAAAQAFLRASGRG